MLLLVYCVSVVLAHAKLALTNDAITFGSANITYGTNQVLLVDGISVRDLAAKLAALNATVAAQSQHIRELQETVHTQRLRLEEHDAQQSWVQNFSQKLERHFQVRDRLEWSLAKSVGSRYSNAWYSLAYGGGMFVAVGSGSWSNESAMSSPDGRNWTIRRTPVGCNWADITFGDGLFVAVGYKGGAGNHDGIMTSADGQVWQPRGVTRTGDWNAVAFGAGVFVALGSVSLGLNSAVRAAMFSADGLSWIDGSLPANFTYSFYSSVRAIAYGQGMFVAVVERDPPTDGAPRSGALLMSMDAGRTWQILTGGIYDNHWSDITYGGGLFVAVTNCYKDGRTCAMASSDGRNWVFQVPSFTTGSDVRLQDVSYGEPGLFVAVSSESDRVLTSHNGIAWEVQAIPAKNNWCAIAYGNHSFVALAVYADNPGSVLVSLLRDPGNGLCLPSLETCTLST